MDSPDFHVIIAEWAKKYTDRLGNEDTQERVFIDALDELADICNKYYPARPVFRAVRLERLRI